MSLANKTAFITGGNSGIGLATARLFVAEGAKVAITGRNKATLEAAAKELGPKRWRSRRMPPTSRHRGRDQQAVENSASSTSCSPTPASPAARRSAARRSTTFEKVIRTNLTAVFFTVQAALPHLKDGASIILNGSVISVLGNPGYAAYAASKAGVRAMARVMASELSPRNIRVNVVSPGATRTPIWGAATATPEAEKAFEKRIGDDDAAGRIGEPDHISKTVLFLASDIPRMSRARNCSSMAVRPLRRPARRSIADSQVSEN